MTKINLPHDKGFANNVVQDPTTNVNNREAIPTEERNSGFVPAYIEPSRQTICQLHYENGLNAKYINGAFKQFQDRYNVATENMKNGVNLPNDVLNTVSDDQKVESIVGGVLGYKFWAALQESDTPELIEIVESNIQFSKQQNLPWGAGSSGGLNAAGAIASSTWIYLYLLGSRFSATTMVLDMASDTNPNGSNIISNIINAQPEPEYKSLKQIMVLPWYNNGGLKFPAIKYYDDWCLYVEDSAQTVTLQATQSSEVPSSYKAVNNPNDATITAFPNASKTLCKMELTASSSNTDNITVLGGEGWKQNLILTPGETVVVDMVLSQSKLGLLSQTPPQDLIVRPLGYKNPSIDYFASVI